MRAVRLFLRARTVINFLMRAASTLEITNGEQRAVPPPTGISLYLNVVLRQVISLTLSKQDNRHKATIGNMIRAASSTIPSSL